MSALDVTNNVRFYRDLYFRFQPNTEIYPAALCVRFGDLKGEHFVSSCLLNCIRINAIKRRTFQRMNNEDATIANIRAQLVARGWTTINEEVVTDKQYEPENNCHLELFHEDGTRQAWGMFPRIYCWTEAYEALTGRPWIESVVRTDLPSP